jgi:hypothetical protein
VILKKRRGAYKKSQVWKTPIVKVDRNKYLTLNRCPLANYEFKKKPEQIRSDSFITIY